MLLNLIKTKAIELATFFVWFPIENLKHCNK